MNKVDIGKPKLLIVDDEPEIVKTLQDFFTLKGYQVIGASSGEEALSILEKERVDLALLDVRLPGIEGPEVAKIIKDKYPATKLVIITGHLEEAQNLINDNLLEGVFIKPVSLREVYDKLSKLVTPSDSSMLDLKEKQGIKARVLMIQARLLFVEASLEIYNNLNKYFKELAKRGESYEMDVVSRQEEIASKVLSFNPDLILVNAAFFKEYRGDLKETIMYNISSPLAVKFPELERLSKIVEAFCFKNGLIDIKWIEV